MDTGLLVGWIVFACILFGSIALYFVPTVVALYRNHRQTAPIVIVNLFFGWTFVGWVVALAWAFAADAHKKA